MPNIDFNTLVLIAVVIILLVAIFVYRSKFSARLKAWGVDLRIDGENKGESPTGADQPGSTAPDTKAGGGAAVATGERSVAVGGNMTNTTINTSGNTTNSKPD